MVKATKVQTWRMFEGTKWSDVRDVASTRESLKAIGTGVRACSVQECQLPYVSPGTRQKVSKQDKRRPRRFLG